MQSDINGQVLSVQGRTTKTQKVIYDVAFSDGNTYTTFDGKLAEKANGLVQQAVTARVKVEQNGQYTNFNLLEIAPQGQLPAAAVAGAPVVVGGGTITVAGAAPSVPIVQGGGGRGMDPAREAKIVKQSCLSTAYGFVGSVYSGAGPESLEEAGAAALALAKELFGQVMGDVPAQAQTAAAVVPTEQTPEAVATAVNDAAGAPVVATGATLPW